MRRYTFEIVNVFAESTFGGNPLAVFSQAEGLSELEMQLLARQMNLSETVFLLPSVQVTAHLRIFTPAHELPFAGHPTLGAASVLHRRQSLGDSFTLQTAAGVIPIRQQDGLFTLQANAASERPSDLSMEQAAAMLGLPAAAVLATPSWLNTGSEQLLIAAASRDAVLAARPVADLFLRDACLHPGRSVAYLWHEADGVATVRLFYGQDGAVLEDPGTGSACANLGGWCSLHQRYPLQWRVEQGAVLQRPNVLHLTVDDARRIYVGGKVVALAQGEFLL
ncbi:PhzF family phenazine biosynthesis protein [Aquitalea palustris]|uniref:PhzF family phenazine biosynthesis protein n=1 Tax=Aquitalea palustris TaxID=2480983 RepID=A0A454JDX9_9NEIS|nr:PhzF family phenazine biosynthesis protein [Aquitalea palustris]RMC92380.1 PhzF family phenazine biosynthesis protein [Aquitalea palustris]